MADCDYVAAGSHIVNYSIIKLLVSYVFLFSIISHASATKLFTSYLTVKYIPYGGFGVFLFGWKVGFFDVFFLIPEKIMQG